LVGANGSGLEISLFDYFSLTKLTFQNPMPLFFRLPKDFLSDGEVLPLFSGKVLCNDIAVGASEVTDAVSEIISHIDLSVVIGDFVITFILILLHTRERRHYPE
jgi:hypothetical protein